MTATHRGLLGCLTQPLSEEETKLFLRLTIWERDKAEIPPTLHTDTGWRMVSGYDKAMGLKANPYLLIWITVLCRSPGQVAMWMHTLAVLKAEKKLTTVTLEDWTWAFPDGIPTEAEHRRVWDLHKAQTEGRAFAKPGLPEG